MEYIPNTKEQREEMLKVIGVNCVEDLLKDIPNVLELKTELNLPRPLTELELKREISKLSRMNKHSGDMVHFLGGGAYDHYIPSAVSHLIFRSEFYTAYTPYQAEMSQGVLQSIYEFQTFISELTGMEVANASMYDGASALAEAAWMATRVTKRKQIVYASTIHPNYRDVLSTYFRGFPSSLISVPQVNGLMDIEASHSMITEKTAAVLVQTPNFFGCLEDISILAEKAHKVGALLVVMVDPLSLGILKSPGELGADIVVGEGQSLGNVLSFGGPYLGFFATRKQYVRQMPGRIVGQTKDSKGKRGFCLTLQTREQHIKRERSTSNICTNEALNALATTIHLALLGKEGVREVAYQSFQKAHYAQKKIGEIKGISIPYPIPFFKEFVVHLRSPVKGVLEKMEKKGFLIGPKMRPYGKNFDGQLLICVTEKRSRDEIDGMVACLKESL